MLFTLEFQINRTPGLLITPFFATLLEFQNKTNTEIIDKVKK